jgi:hypothetical protein
MREPSLGYVVVNVLGERRISRTEYLQAGTAVPNSVSAVAIAVRIIQAPCNQYGPVSAPSDNHQL